MRSLRFPDVDGLRALGLAEAVGRYEARGHADGAVAVGHRLVDERRVDEPGAHHPAQVAGPGDDVAGPDILVQPAVRRALDGGTVRPGDRLRIPGGSGGKENVAVLHFNRKHSPSHLLFTDIARWVEVLQVFYKIFTLHAVNRHGDIP